MDIIIKSFNRPYYLERCIRSIYKFIEGDFEVKVLDDGTAPHYMQKIKALFPDVKIEYSPYHDQKWKAIADHIAGKKDYKSLAIPSRFWYEHIAKATEIFLLLEDDIWLTAPVNLNELLPVMQKNHYVLLRLFWQGNPHLICGGKSSVSNNIEEIHPEIAKLNRLLLRDTIKVTTMLKRLRFIKHEIRYQLPFYTLYTVAGAFFNKQYWLYLWEHALEKVHEPEQLKKALNWFEQQGGRFAKMKIESAQTSYITSATGWLDGINFDMSNLNFILNEAWLNGQLDVMDNFPKDFNKETIKSHLNVAGDNRCTYLEWQNWIKRFKNGYESLGCKTE